MSVKRTAVILKPLLPYLADPSVTLICKNRNNGLGNDDDDDNKRSRPKTPRPYPSPATV